MRLLFKGESFFKKASASLRKSPSKGYIAMPPVTDSLRNFSWAAKMLDGERLPPHSVRREEEDALLFAKVDKWFLLARLTAHEENERPPWKEDFAAAGTIERGRATYGRQTDVQQGYLQTILMSGSSMTKRQACSYSLSLSWSLYPSRAFPHTSQMRSESMFHTYCCYLPSRRRLCGIAFSIRPHSFPHGAATRPSAGRGS